MREHIEESVYTDRVADASLHAEPLESRNLWSRLIAPTVAVGLAIATALVALIANDVTQRQEDELLRERTSELAAILSVSTSEVRSVLLVAGTSTTLRGATRLFDSVTGPAAASGADVVVVERRGNAYVALARSGKTAPAIGAKVGPTVEAIANRARTSKDVVSTVVRTGSGARLVFAMSVAGDPRRVAYLDTRLTPPNAAPVDPDSPYRELNVALYAADRANAEQLVLVSGMKPGTGDGVVRKEFKVGAETWLLAVSARRPLVGSIATAFPWLLVGAGVATALILGLLIEILVRRRAYAMRLVADRTRSLRLAQAEAERTRESFFATVSHDIRAPLTAIQGFAEMIPAVESARQKEYLGRVQNNVTRLGVMVDNMLDHARLRSGALPLAIEPINLSDAVRVCVRDLAPVLASHHVLTSDSEVDCLADRQALGRVLTNLLVNAAKYSPTGSTIEVSVDADSSHGRVVIADHGRGIPQADLATIFDEFERGTLAEADGGSGLGLSSVHQLVTLQHGRVAIKSTPGVGTEVTVELRLAPASRQVLHDIPAGSSRTTADTIG